MVAFYDRVTTIDTRLDQERAEIVMSVNKGDDVSPREVKSLQKLASSNFGKFAIQVQHMSADVQMKIIAQLPEFRKLATDAIDKISKAHEATLASDERGEDQVHAGIKEWRGALIAMLDDPDLTLDDKLRITAEIGETVKVQKAVHADGVKARAALFGTVTLAVIGAVGVIVVAITGGKVGIDQGDNNA